MVFSYIRVSSDSQRLDRQTRPIAEYAAAHGLTVDRVFEEKQSGKDFERPVYRSMKLALRRGDILIVTELDRLGRNMGQIKDEWRELERAGVEMIVVENELLNTADKTDLEKTLISNIVFDLLSYLAEKERMKIRSRQAAGIKLAKTRGAYRGRKPVAVDEEDFAKVYSRWKGGELTAVKAMEALGVKKDVFYRLVRERAG